jgi:methionine synthase I (cobalamin-dependent)
VDVVETVHNVLTDGATGTRLRLEAGLTLDPVLDVADLAVSGRGNVLRAVAGEYLISCTHPSAALAGMRRLRASGREVSDRLIGIKANGSAMDLGQLDGAGEVMADAPLEWLTDLTVLRNEFGFRVVGGCCGTDSRHILALGLAMQ